MSTIATSGARSRTIARRSSAVSQRADHFESVVGEETLEALAQEHAVFGDHDPHGISALTRVPPPSGVQIRSRPPSASTRSASPRRPEPRSVSAPPMPSSTTSTIDVAPSPRVTVDGRRGRVGVLADVRDALADDVVRGDLDRLGQPSVDLDLQVQRDRGMGRELFERDRETVRAHDRGMDAAGDVAELGQRHRDLLSRLIEARPSRPGRR